MSYLLEMAEHFYATARELIKQGERAMETGRYLNKMADRMCEQNIAEVAKAERAAATVSEVKP